MDAAVFSDTMRGCERQEKAAQQHLFEAFKDQLMPICMRYARNETQANELLKQGFADIFGTFRQVASYELLSEHLRNSMVNSAIKALCKNSTDYKIVSTVNAKTLPPLEDLQPDSELIQNLNDEVVLKALQSLPVVYRLIINLALIEKYPFNQIAEKLEEAELTLRMNYEKAMHLFRKTVVHLTSTRHANK